MTEKADQQQERRAGKRHSRKNQGRTPKHKLGKKKRPNENRSRRQAGRRKRQGRAKAVDPGGQPGRTREGRNRPKNGSGSGQQGDGHEHARTQKPDQAPGSRGRAVTTGEGRKRTKRDQAPGRRSMALSTEEGRNRTRLAAVGRRPATRDTGENRPSPAEQGDGRDDGRGQKTNEARSSSEQQGGHHQHGRSQKTDQAPGSRTTANNTTEGRKRAQHRATRQRPSTRGRAETGPSRT